MMSENAANVTTGAVGESTARRYEAFARGGGGYNACMRPCVSRVVSLLVAGSSATTVALLPAVRSCSAVGPWLDERAKTVVCVVGGAGRTRRELVHAAGVRRCNVYPQHTPHLGAAVYVS